MHLRSKRKFNGRKGQPPAWSLVTGSRTSFTLPVGSHKGNCLARLGAESMWLMQKQTAFPCILLGIRNGYYPVVPPGHAALTLEASHHREQQSLTTAQPALCRLELPDACAFFSPCGHATLFDCIVLRRSKEIQRETTCFWGSSSSKP